MKVKVNLSNQTLEYMDSQPYIQGTDTRNVLNVYIEHEDNEVSNIMIAYALQNGRTTIKMANTGATQETIDDVVYDVFYFTAPSVLTSVAGNFVATIILKVNTNIYKVNVLNTVLNAVDFEAFEDALDDTASEVLESLESMAGNITYLQSQVVGVLHNTDIVDNDDSNDPTKVLSARMGKVLAERIGATTSGLVSAAYNESTGVLTLTYENDDTYEMKIGLDATDIQAMSDDVLNDVNDDLTSYKNQVNQSLEDMTETIEGLGNLEPSGTDTATNILAKTSNQGIFVATDNGHWYYWNGTQYVDGGTYQATQIADGSVTPKKLSPTLQEKNIQIDDKFDGVSGACTLSNGGSVSLTSNEFSGTFNQWSNIQFRQLSFQSGHKYIIDISIKNNSSLTWQLTIKGLSLSTGTQVDPFVNNTDNITVGSTYTKVDVWEPNNTDYLIIAPITGNTHGSIEGTVYAYDVTDLSQDVIDSIDWATLKGSTTYTISDISNVAKGLTSGSTEKQDIEDLKTELLKTRITWNCLSTYRAIVGKTTYIYFNEICDHIDNGFFEISDVVNATYNDITYDDRRVVIKPTSAKTFSFDIGFYDYLGNLIGTKKTISVTSKSLSNFPAKKYMFIGDSLTANGTMQKTFVDDANNTTANSCVLYGTRGTAPYLNEGRGGWTIWDYYAVASKGDVVNEFYNPDSNVHKFDFSYYMTNHPEFADVDVVNIFLGRNDGYYTNNIQHLVYMINDIKNYNSNIIVTVMCAYNVGSDNSACGKYLQNSFEYNILGHKFNNSLFLQTVFNESNGVYLIPQYYNLDNTYDYATTMVNVSSRNTEQIQVFTDNVHPKTSGYEHFADVYFNYINSIYQN